MVMTRTADGVAESMRFLKRLLQRLLIFGLGIFIVWLIVFVVFETADSRLPWVLAVGVTYGIAAYIILPRAIRLGLKILQRKRVPSYTITGDGLPGDPVNVALIGTLQQLRAAFASLGWSEADRLGAGQLVAHDPGIRIQLAISDRPVQHPLSFRTSARTSVSRRRSTTARGSAIIYGFGL